MNRIFPKVSLLAFALALSANSNAADSVPATAATARVNAEAGRKDAEAARVDAEGARRELEVMREQMHDLSRKMADVSAKLGDVGPRAYTYRYLGNPDRGMIGVVFNDDDSSGTKGLRVDAVTPGGPADND